ncbi:hypothetical protein KY290_011340 [Solanum tuberosum]|uniref:Uncharacterized protein n=1 Tax=Solanum tuberosum TaxID=4113 RepID=A0ABQ7W0E0_SOLTU|nr:hypothetical protein KY290_011340 [Solanum tuberosum]
MCLLAVPFECYRCRWREPRGPKYVVLKLGNRFLDTRFGRSGNGGLCLVLNLRGDEQDTLEDPTVIEFERMFWSNGYIFLSTNGGGEVVN